VISIYWILKAIYYRDRRLLTTFLTKDRRKGSLIIILRALLALIPPQIARRVHLAREYILAKALLIFLLFLSRRRIYFRGITRYYVE
jgi:hypothetical protein